MANNLFSNISKKLEEIKKIENLNDKELKLLLTPERISKAQLNIKGKKYAAWRILFNNALGPGKGGIRFHPQVNEDEVKSLSFWMAIKTALAGIPYGGAKGGVRFNPKKTNKKELEQISRKYIGAFYKVLGEDIDVPAPDIYTNSQIMAWMLDEYEKKIGKHQPAMITGKPLELQGCSLRGTATAKGGFIIIKEMVKKLQKGKKNLRVAIQGFGNAGANIAEMLSRSGFTIIAVSDSKGGVYQLSGLDIAKIIKSKKDIGSVVGYKQGKKISNQELLTLSVDILILAALENQITDKNAGDIKAKYIVEIANGPITYEADKKLFAKGILVVPDILANAGGVIVSYFEWSQNKAGNILDAKYLENLLVKKMKGMWEKTYKLYQSRYTAKRKIDLRTAAYIISINRIITGERLRGKL